MKYINNKADSEIFQRIKKVAEHGIFDGKNQDNPYLLSCRWFVEKYGCSVIFTKDEGMHSCGWWKNPDYERCYHLSISFPGGKNKNKLQKILTELFGNYTKWLWEESPYSEQGKQNEIWHYRLFCDVQWKPIMPKKEVYSTDFTPNNWKSFSELNYR